MGRDGYKTTANMSESSPNRDATATASNTHVCLPSFPCSFSRLSSSLRNAGSGAGSGSNRGSDCHSSVAAETDISDSDSDSDTPSAPVIWILFPLGKNPKFLHNLPKATQTQLYHRSSDHRYTVTGIKGDVNLFLETIHDYCQVPRRAKVSLSVPPLPPLDRASLYVTVRVPGWEGVDPVLEMERIMEIGFRETVRLAGLIEEGELEFGDVVYGGGFGR